MNDLSAFKVFLNKDKIAMPKGNNAVIYTRVSHSSQEDNTSLDTQLKNCEIFAKKKGYEVVGYFGGTYESAKTDDRKEFNRMLEFIKKNKTVSAIIVYSYERFTRSGVQGAKIAEDLLNKRGIVTLSVTQELDPRTIAGTFQQQIFFMFSRMDNEMRREKTVTGMTELVRKGVVPYSIPRGYSNLNKGSRAIDQRLVINEDGKFLKKAFEWKSKYNYSDTEIVKKLKEIGFSIDPRRLGSIFKNPFYCGIIVSKLIPDEIIVGNHEPLVEKEIFLKINKVKTELSSAFLTKTIDNEFLPLKRFAKCSKCNQKLTGFIVKKKNLFYYKCKNVDCKTNVSAKYLHEQFSNVLKDFYINPENFSLLESKIRDLFKSKFKEKEQDNKLLKQHYNSLKSKIEKIEERYVIGEIEKALYDKFSKKYNEELNDLENKLMLNSRQSSNIENCIKFAKMITQKPQEIWEKLDYAQKRLFQILVFPEGILFNKGTNQIQTTKINAFFDLMRRNSDDYMLKESGVNIMSDELPRFVTLKGF